MVVVFFVKNMLLKLIGVCSVIENIDDDIMCVFEDVFWGGFCLYCLLNVNLWWYFVGFFVFSLCLVMCWFRWWSWVFVIVCGCFWWFCLGFMVGFIFSWCGCCWLGYCWLVCCVIDFWWYWLVGMLLMWGLCWLVWWFFCYCFVCLSCRLGLG